MTVADLIARLQQVRNQDALVNVCSQLSTEWEDCTVDRVEDDRADFGPNSEGAVWLHWPGADYKETDQHGT